MRRIPISATQPTLTAHNKIHQQHMTGHRCQSPPHKNTITDDEKKKCNKFITGSEWTSKRMNEKKLELMNILVQRRPHWWLLAILRSGPTECTTCIWHHFFPYYYFDYCSPEWANHLNGNRFRFFLSLSLNFHLFPDFTIWPLGKTVLCACAAHHLIHSNCNVSVSSS